MANDLNNDSCIISIQALGLKGAFMEEHQGVSKLESSIKRELVGSSIS